MSNWGEAAETRANKHSSQNGDDIYYIFNKKYGTGVKVPQDADRVDLVGCRQTKDDHQGYRWRLERYNNSTQHRIHSADLEWSAVRDHAHPDFIQTGKKGHWWIIKPTLRDENCHLISHIDGGGYWGLDEGSDGTTIKLRDSTGDDANLWQFESVSAITPKISSIRSPGAPDSFKSRPVSRNESKSATVRLHVPQAYVTYGRRTDTASRRLPNAWRQDMPAPTPVFTGRRDKLKQIKACISRGDRERCVFVLHGLGGAGKTQLALKTVQDTRDMWTVILFVDATSRETATRALGAFAKDRKIGQTERDTMRWLENRRERWLMVFDNADDPSAHIDDFFPGGGHGSIVITTRIPGMAVLARGLSSDFGVSNMEPGEALNLLLKTARIQGNALEEAEWNAANKLLKSFGYLALAIIQAGAYIRCSERTIRQYRDMFVKHRQATLERYAEVLIKVDNYQKSVYMTWLLSYERLSTHAQRLLHLVAFMDRSNITEDIFRRAASNLSTYEPEIPATGDEAKVRTYVMEFLQPYLNSAGAWDSGVFLSTMTELTSYSLMSHDRTSGAYTMHVLVHDWASTVTNHPLEVAVQHTALLLAVSIDCDDTMESLVYKRGVEMHVNRVLERQLCPGANNAARFAEVYNCAGKWKQYQKLEEVALGGRRQVLGDEHRSTLASMHNLAVAYREQGRYKKAEKLLSRVVASRKRLSGEEHPSTLNSMSALAYTYFLLERYDEALSLQTRVTETSKRTLGEQDPRTLTSMGELAVAYSGQGRYKQAEALQVQVLNAMEGVYGRDHPETLAIVLNLADTYWSQGRHEQAEGLGIRAVAGCKRVFGSTHPHTLFAMDELAATYQSLGKQRQKQYEELQVEIQRLEALSQ